MARYSDHPTAKIYEAAYLFRSQCLEHDGSILFSGTSLWTTSLLEQFRQVFSRSKDESDRAFLVKYQEQVGKAGKDVIRLAAEALCLYFLFPSNVGGPRKREVVNAVLGWSGDTLPPENLVSQAFETGIGSGGQGYNTRRPFELEFLIDFVIAWKELPVETRQQAISDPWKFQVQVDAVGGGDGRQLRHMLLHLLFPDEFERIVDEPIPTRHFQKARLQLPKNFIDEGIEGDAWIAVVSIKTQWHRPVPCYLCLASERW